MHLLVLFTRKLYDVLKVKNSMVKSVYGVKKYIICILIISNFFLSFYFPSPPSSRNFDVVICSRLQSLQIGSYTSGVHPNRSLQPHLCCPNYSLHDVPLPETNSISQCTLQLSIIMQGISKNNFFIFLLVLFEVASLAYNSDLTRNGHVIRVRKIIMDNAV